MFDGNPNAFCANPLDRAGVARKDPSWLDKQKRHPKAKLLLFYEGELLVDRQPTSARIQWLTMDAIGKLPMGREVVLLGLWDGAPIYATDGSGAARPPFAELGAYVPLRNAAPFLPPEELSVAGQAAWLLGWHRRTKYCAEHGAKLVSAEGGFKRVNPETKTEHFPRADPVAITLPVRGDEVCLGRGPHFPQGFMSAFAGYLEPGETLEQCGARELYEEVGLRAKTMEYVFSQPWPFPSSLMMGFIAEVEGRLIELDPTEIAEARWFSRDEARAILEGDHDIMAPPPMAIAHQLLKVWVGRG